jgi:hypothetical protein
MSRVIVSPSKQWPGKVVLQDPILWPAYLKLREGITQAPDVDETQRLTLALPGICACVEEWQLEGLGQVTPDTFPASPTRASFALFAWLLEAVMGLLIEAEDVPNS